MAASLDETKNRLRAMYIGRGGIHALGINQEQQTIKVYADGSDATRSDVLQSLREAARPFKIIVIEEEAPRIR